MMNLIRFGSRASARRPLPAAPAGYVFLLDAQGRYLIDALGRFLVEPA